MKKRFLVLFAALSASMQIVSAQELLNEVNPATTLPSVPKFEFTINGFGGMSTFLYGVKAEPEFGMEKGKLNPDFVDGLAPGGGLGFVWHFSKHWGISSGAEFMMYRAKIDVTNFVGRKNSNADYGAQMFRFNKFSEKQVSYNLEFPIMLQYMTPIGAAKANNFYVEAGARLGYMLKTKYEQDFNKMEVGYYSIDNAQGGRDINWDPNNRSLSNKGDIDMKLNVVGALETGIRWKLSPAVGLYTGIYAGIGLINPVKNSYFSVIEENKANLPAGTTGGNDKLYHSVLEAKENIHYTGEIDANKALPTTGGEKLLAPMRTMAAGLRLRLTFGKPHKAPAVVPAPVVITKVDTVEKVKVVRDTVEKVKVVRDTVTVVKEIPVEIKRTMMELSNTLFAFDKFNLNDEAKLALDKVAAWLKENEDLNIEISGHTDGKGSQEYNQTLSENRAKAVYDYFVGHGVKADRLSYKGYGKLRPIADNDTEAGRKQNRRVELNIVGQ